MLGQMMKVSDENFAVNQTRSVIVVLDVISVKPKSLKAAVKRDLKLIRSGITPSLQRRRTNNVDS
jgi:hypothetical protein